MIGYWLLAEILQRHSPWIVPNLLATTFFGEGAYRAGFMHSTWAGLAAPLVVYSITGIVFALAVREQRRSWAFLLVTTIAGLVFDWLIFGVALRRINPLVQLYSPDRLIAVSHLLYGAALSTYPRFAAKLLPPPPIPNSCWDLPRSNASDQQVGRSIP